MYLLKTLFTIGAITGTIMHIWTVIIGFTEGGFWGGVITLILPFLAEVYWMFKMMGENNLYVFLVAIHLILSVLYKMSGMND